MHPVSALTMLSYGFLFLAIISLWLPPACKVSNMPLWSIAAGAACCFGWINNQLDPAALVLLAVFAYTLFTLQTKPLSRFSYLISVTIILLAAVALAAHAIPYFHNLLVLEKVSVSPNALPFTLYLNFDKALVGLLLLGMTGRLIATRQQWLALSRQALPFSVIFALLLLLAGCLAGKITIDPKLPDFLPLWLINNLLIVCVAEEAFFRGFVQQQLSLLWQKYAWGPLAALTLASLLFGFAHYAGGIAYSAWGMLAGLGYGWIYQKTGYIEAGIIAHFCLNLLHMLFFTYPVLAGS